MSGERGRVVGEVVDFDPAGGGFLLRPDDGGAYLWVSVEDARSQALEAGARVAVEGTWSARLDEDDLRRLAAETLGVLRGAA